MTVTLTTIPLIVGRAVNVSAICVGHMYYDLWSHVICGACQFMVCCRGMKVS